MTNEAYQPHPELPTNQDQLAVPAQANLAFDHELTATAQLAGNLAVVSQEHGVAGVAEYIGDVLSDTESKVPIAERQAVFKLLSSEQRKALHEKSVSAGEAMLEDISTRNRITKERVEDNGRLTKLTAGELTDEHRAQVGRHFRDGVDTHRAVRGHESLEDGVRKQRRLAHELSEIAQDWRGSGRATVKNFESELERANNHEQALYAAEKVTDVDYSGEPKNVASVIDETVKQEISTKISAAVSRATEDGGDLQEAVLKVLLEDKSDEITTEELKALTAFAEHYDRFTAVHGSQIQAETEKVDFSMKRFMRRGQEDYTYVRTIGEAQDVYRRQSQALQNALTEASAMAPHTAKILETERGDLSAVQQYLARAKSLAVQKH